MKKITLVTIFLFTSAVFGIFAFRLFPKNISSQITASQKNVSTAGVKTFTNEEVAKHSTPSDCYLIVNAQIYNVSSYISQHPGGRRNIISNCGKEVSKIFATIHSNFAWNLLKDFYVGDLATNVPVQNTNTANQVLNNLKNSLLRSYQGAEVINVKPKQNFYVAKIIYQGTLYEIHIDKNGKILSEEVQNSEINWGSWNTDADDNE